MRRGRNGRGGAPSMLARASAQAGNGAGALFARLDATAARGEQGAEVLTRLAQLLRAGAWSDEIASFVARGEALEKTISDA